MPSSLDEFSDAPLTPTEIKKARKIIRDQERMDWLWASARVYVGWGFAGIAALYAAKDHVIGAVKGWFAP